VYRSNRVHSSYDLSVPGDKYGAPKLALSLVGPDNIEEALHFDPLGVWPPELPGALWALDLHLLACRRIQHAQMFASCQRKNLLVGERPIIWPECRSQWRRVIAEHHAELGRAAGSVAAPAPDFDSGLIHRLHPGRVAPHALTIQGYLYAVLGQLVF